jgi:hypothetical protein
MLAQKNKKLDKFLTASRDQITAINLEKTKCTKSCTLSLGPRTDFLLQQKRKTNQILWRSNKQDSNR